MQELRLELTDELMAKIAEAAKGCLVTPEHWATCTLSAIFRDEKGWAQKALPVLVPVLEGAARSLKQFMASESRHEED